MADVFLRTFSKLLGKVFSKTLLDACLQKKQTLIVQWTACYGIVQDYHKILLSEEKFSPKIISPLLFVKICHEDVFEDIITLVWVLEKGVTKP